jgi:hypothetical protein
MVLAVYAATADITITIPPMTQLPFLLERASRSSKLGDWSAPYGGQRRDDDRKLTQIPLAPQDRI